MIEKHNVRTAVVKFRNEEYRMFFLGYTAYIDVRKFWEEQVGARTDLFVPPEGRMAIHIENGMEELTLATLEDLKQAIHGLRNHTTWWDYVSEEKFERLCMFAQVLSEVEANGEWTKLHLNDETFVWYE